MPESIYHLDWAPFRVADFGPSDRFQEIGRIKEFGMDVMHAHFLNPFDPVDVYGFLMGMKAVEGMLPLYEQRVSTGTADEREWHQRALSDVMSFRASIQQALLHFVPPEALDGHPTTHISRGRVQVKAWSSVIPIVKMTLETCVYADDLESREYYEDLRVRSARAHGNPTAEFCDMVCRMLIGARCVSFMAAISKDSQVEEVQEIILTCLCIFVNDYIDFLPEHVRQEVGYYS